MEAGTAALGSMELGALLLVHSGYYPEPEGVGNAALRLVSGTLMQADYLEPLEVVTEGGPYLAGTLSGLARDGSQIVVRPR